MLPLVLLNDGRENLGMNIWLNFYIFRLSDLLLNMSVRYGRLINRLIFIGLNQFRRGFNEWNYNIRLPCYNHRLNLIGLKSIIQRRAVADLVFFHQILCGNTMAVDISEKLSFRINNNNLRHTLMFDVPFRRTLYGCNEPISRALRLFNVNSGNFNINYSKHKLG